MDFTLTNKQKEKIKAWMDSIPNPDEYTGAIGGRFSFIFIPTSIGTVVIVTDSISKTELDATDYESW
jgi:hypothetical protein